MNKHLSVLFITIFHDIWHSTDLLYHLSWFTGPGMLCCNLYQFIFNIISIYFNSAFPNWLSSYSGQLPANYFWVLEPKKNITCVSNFIFGCILNKIHKKYPIWSKFGCLLWTLLLSAPSKYNPGYANYTIQFQFIKSFDLFILICRWNICLTYRWNTSAFGSKGGAEKCYIHDYALLMWWDLLRKTYNRPEL